MSQWKCLPVALRATAVGAVMAFLAAASAAPAARSPAVPQTGSQAVVSRLDVKAGSRLADEAIGSKQRLGDRRLSDERYLKYEKKTFRMERKASDAVETGEREKEAADRLRARVRTPENKRSSRAFDLLFR